MNRVYRVIYNKSTRTWQAVTEFAKAQGKSSSAVVGGISRLIFFPVRFALTALALSLVSILPAQAAVVQPSINTLRIITSGTGTPVYIGDMTSSRVVIGESSRAEENATAVGHGAEATAQRSTALGKEATATAEKATAVGFDSSANAESATAVGHYSFSGTTKGIAMGHNATSVSINAFQQAEQAYKDAYAQELVDLGVTEDTASDEDKRSAREAGEHARAATLRASDSSAGLNTIAIGTQSLATHNNAIAFGTTTKATGEQSVAISQNANASGKASIAMGVNAEADSLANIAIGENAKALTADKNVGDKAGKKDDTNGINKAIAIGSGSQATHAKTIAIGDQANASGRNANAIGSQANVSGLESTGIGVRTSVTGDYATAIGQRASAEGTHSTAVGTLSKAIGANSGAFGREASATGTSAMAMGYGATTNANHAVAIGTGAKATSQSAIALGQGANASAKQNAMALGVNSVASGQSSTAVGQSSQATALNSVALGAGAKATLDRSVALGAYSEVATGMVVTEATVNGVTYGGFAGVLADQNKVVSVGNRQIQHVSAGQISATSTDAINGSQLYMVAKGTLEQMPVVYTKGDGTKVYKRPDGTFIDGNNNVVPNEQVIASMNSGGNSTTNPMTLTNIKGNLAPIDTATTEQPSANHPVLLNDVKNNAATVGDVLNAGWNLQGNGNAVDTVVHADTVNFIDGNATTAVVNTDGKTSSVTYDVKVDEATIKIVDGKLTAINNSGFNLQANGDTASLVKAGATVQFIDGDNIEITRDGNNITVNTKRDVDFDSISVGDDAINIDASGIDMGGNKITNVATGTADTDAVNVSQLKGFTTQVNHIVGGTDINGNVIDGKGNTLTTVIDSSKDPNAPSNQSPVTVTAHEALKTYDAVGVGTVETNSVLTAIKNINEQGTKYIHFNGGERSVGGERDKNSEQSQANGSMSTAIGKFTVADGDHAVAIGNAVKANGVSSVSIGNQTIAGEQSIAIGDKAQATGLQSIAIGTQNTVSGKHSGAIGDPTVVTGDNAYSVGNRNTISANNTYALGSDITATLDNSIYLGDKSSSTGVHTTADGGHYTYAGVNDANVAGVVNSKTAPNTDPVGVVTVGTEKGQTRQIQNVSAGVVSPTSTDAINGSQLYDTHQVIGNLANSTINMGNHLNNRIDAVADDANAGVSSAMAMAALPQAYLPGKSMLTGGMATYNGEGAVAVGLSKLSDNGRWVLKMSGSADTQGNAGAAVGAGFHF